MRTRFLNCTNCTKVEKHDDGQLYCHRVPPTPMMMIQMLPPSVMGAPPQQRQILTAMYPPVGATDYCTMHAMQSQAVADKTDDLATDKANGQAAPTAT